MVFARGHMSSLKFYAVLFSRGEGDVPCLDFNEGISWTEYRLCTVYMYVCMFLDALASLKTMLDIK